MTVTALDMQVMLQEISNGIAAAKWERRGLEAWGAESYYADVGPWRVFVAEFETGDPEEPHHRDGTATREGVVLHLTPDLARRCFDLARASHEK